MKRRDWRLEAIGWDGALPLLVALTPEVLLICRTDPGLAKFISIGLVPLFASLFRAHRGERQIKMVCPTGRTWHRQCVLALAIVVVMGFETMLATLQCERVMDLRPWLIVVGLYLIYLGLVAIALQPRRLPKPKGPKWRPWKFEDPWDG